MLCWGTWAWWNEKIEKEDAFASWLAKGALGKSTGYRWRSSCGSDGASPCETGSHCAPPVF